MMDQAIVKSLGPLAGLVGIWEGDQGLDEAPSASRGTLQTSFRERAVFEAIGPVDNRGSPGHAFDRVAHR